MFKYRGQTLIWSSVALSVLKKLWQALLWGRQGGGDSWVAERGSVDGAWVKRWQGCLLRGSTGEQSSSNRWDALGVMKQARGHEGRGWLRLWGRQGLLASMAHTWEGRGREGGEGGRGKGGWKYEQVL